MALTKISKVGNFLKIEITGQRATYGNSIWYEIKRFTDNSVVLLYQGEKQWYKEIEILFADFQDDIGGSYNTESLIVNYLSDKIG